MKDFPVRHGWNSFVTQALPIVRDQEAPLMTPGQRYRAGLPNNGNE
jgi:hypothetical protein